MQKLGDDLTYEVEQPRRDMPSSRGSEIGQQNDELSVLRARISAYELELKRLALLLSKLEAELSNKNDILLWITNSRSWRMTSWMRRLKFLIQPFRRSSGNLASFQGLLETPQENSKIARFLEVSGWVFSNSPISRVEAFIDSIPVGTLQYGQARADISSYPSQAPLNCGYQGKLLIDESFKGWRTLAVRVTDKRGHAKDFSQTILIEDSAEAQVPTTPLNPRQVIGSDDGALNLFLRDDLSTAKRLQALTAKISLESFLISGSTIEFPHYEVPKVSILLVLHNRAELTLQCFTSILNSSESYEVVIVDNASTDETKQLLKQVNGAHVIHNERNIHYLQACNQASKLARGEHLLLLNNDAQLQRHTLSSALKTFASAGDIGAVGGKVILPDGTLQEAGSIVWQDGSCLGYGRGDSPFNPQYMFKRDVDYCSAAFLLIRRAPFLEVGGFDEAYNPAYYEETDYCVKLWKEGKRVVYDPDATVLHYEFASSDSSQSAIELQSTHRWFFVSKHAEWLHGQQRNDSKNILAASSRLPEAAKRILLLDDRVPHNILGSGFPRSNRILWELVRMGHFVTCYPLNVPQEDWASVYQDIPREVEVMLDQGPPRLEQFLKEREGYYDMIFVSRPHNMALLKAILEKKPELCTGFKIVYDAEALFSLRKIEEMRLKGRRLSPQDRQRLLDEEIRLAEGCDQIISVSERECSEFSRHGFERVHMLGHAMVASPTPNSFSHRRDILFVGAIHTSKSPNADAVIWFSRKIFPKIQKKLGQVSFIVVGLIHPDVEDQLRAPSVQIKGQVKDLNELYNQARIFVAPTRFSAGIPHKIHEAAAHGLPTVTTSLVGRQLGWEAGNDLLMADDDDSFANACVQLYQDQQLWSRLRQNALDRVPRECLPETFTERLRAIVE
jgi:GT2 family glycosyltransferase/glycosyltransferase involved in cell wall biosynthesis